MPRRLKSLVKLHYDTIDQPVVFSYRGPFLECFTNTILEIFQGSITAQQVIPTINRKVSFLLVECFQNILKHGEVVAGSDPGFRDDGLFSFRIQGSSFIINSINMVQPEEADGLRSMMEEINSYEPQDLKALYLKQLANSSLSDKGGAGLGLIELARKSGQQVLYLFEDAPGGLVFFHQQVTFCPGKERWEIVNRIDEIRALYDQMNGEHTLLSYKGDFSQKAIIPILEMVEYHMASSSEAGAQGRKAGHVLVEILQNIAKHGGDKQGRAEGIVTIGMYNGQILLQSGNVVSETEKEFLTEKLVYLRQLNHEELKDLHRTALKASLKFENKMKSGLGLIEIAQASTIPFNFEFNPSVDDRCLFTIQVSI